MGEASSFPGKIANSLCPNIFQNLCRQLTKGMILITGTNGKTTTSLLLSKIFSTNDIVHNKSGANFESGLITALLEKTKINGRIKADYAIFEVDELVVAKVSEKCHPIAIVVLNLFRDQLERYGEIQTILKSWQKAIVNLPIHTQIFINADDPALCHLGDLLPQRVTYFGLNEPKYYLKSMPNAMDSLYCPRCERLLVYQGFYLSHLGDYFCKKCLFCKKEPAIDSQKWSQISNGIYNKYNTMAAISIAKKLGINELKIRGSIHHFKPAFGRGETIVFKGKKVLLLLSKNPVSMNEMIQRVSQLMDQGNVQVIIFALNDQEMDGRDISWIWEVDMQSILARKKRLILTGSRAYELALCVKYGSKEKMEGGRVVIEENLKKAISIGLKNTLNGAFLPILPTYTAMLKVRKILVGRKFL